MYYGYRRPLTTNERRANEALRTDNDIVEVTGRVLTVRAKRVNLPTSHDDLSNNAYYRRSWKAYRKTQYKGSYEQPKERA